MAALSSVTSAAKETRADLELLQGAWASVSGRHPTELLIAGNLFAVKFLDGKIYMGTFDLDAGERPKEMVMRIDEGPVKHKGKFALCIYELDGDTFRWCPTEPGSDERLTDFPDVGDGRYLCTVFQRQRPRQPG
ncbi:MAG TPA: hypothetical protein VKD72_25210 [Gemmataceae bacterium]|nr:hypothetical protein [Gemmataceae bacterium]